jgi:hypothetical protein
MADKTQWTPGPWIRSGLEISAHIRGIHDTAGRPTLIARISQLPCIRGSDDLAAAHAAEMESANAQLLVTAPELYTALELLLSNWPADRDGMDYEGPLPVGVKSGRAVLNKARNGGPND